MFRQLLAGGLLCALISACGSNDDATYKGSWTAIIPLTSSGVSTPSAPACDSSSDPNAPSFSGCCPKQFRPFIFVGTDSGGLFMREPAPTYYFRPTGDNFTLSIASDSGGFEEYGSASQVPFKANIVRQLVYNYVSHAVSIQDTYTLPSPSNLAPYSCSYEGALRLLDGTYVQPDFG